jgi:hypothetical protein
MIAEIVACQAFKLAYKKNRHWQNYLFDREKMHFGMVGCTNQHVRQATPRHEIVFFTQLDPVSSFRDPSR